MTFLAFAGLVNFITCIGLAFFIIINNPLNSQARAYFWLNSTVSIYSIGYFFWQISTSSDIALIWFKFLFTGIALINISYIHFIIVSLGIFSNKYKFLILCYFINVIFIVLNWNNYLYSGLSNRFGFGLWPNPTAIFNLYLLFWFWQCIYGFSLLYKASIKTKGIRQQQIKYFMIAAAIGFIGGATNWFFWYKIYFPPYLNILISVYVLLTAYAITKTRLMDIKVVLEKGLIYSIASVISGILFAVPILLPQYLFNINVFNNLLILTLVVFMVITLFKPIEELTKKGVIRLFFSQKYKLEQIANKFSDGISRFMKRDEFGEYVTRSATSVFKLNGGASFIYSKKNNQFECADGRGTLKFLKGTIIDKDNPLIKEMMKQNKSILREDFEFAMAQKKDRENIKEIVSAFQNLKSHICVPSISNVEKGHLLGFFLGDEKKSGEPYSQEDIVLLEIFGNQAAASIDNVLLYENQVETLKSSMELEKFASLGETTATVAHEIKNALSYVVTFPQVLEKRKDDAAFLEKAPDTFLHEVERIDLVMQGIVNYAKPSPLKIERLKLKDLIEETLVLIKSKAKNNRVEVEFICDENLFIEADWNKLKQVFLNLFLNALDAMILGGRLKIEAAKDNSFIIIKIEDTGVGIPKEKLETIFEAFYTTKENGTGLGLAIVKQIIEQNNGTISVESEEGKGTIFALRFQLI